MWFGFPFFKKRKESPVTIPETPRTMRDKISIERASLLHPKVRKEVIDTITKVESGFPEWIAVRIVEGLRTHEVQAEYYARGRTKPGKRITNAKPGQSYHQFGFAIDFALLIDKDRNGSFETISWDTAADLDKDGVIDWQEMVREFEALGWTWGGKFRTFPDYPHIQKTFGYSVSQLQKKYEAKDFIPRTKYLNL